MFILILNYLTISILVILGIFSLRRLIFGITAISLKPDWSLVNTNVAQPFVTVLIPCHNEESVLFRTLDALLNIEYPSEKLEIVVIDDQSSDDTLQKIQDYAKRYSHIHAFQRSKDKMRGKAASLNEALTGFTRGEIVYFLDADHSVTPDALSRLVRHFSDPTIGAVNGRSVPWNRYDSLISSYVYIESLVHNRVTMYASDKLGLAPGVLGSNFCMRRSLIEKIGFFNEDLLTEDLDLTMNIYKHGYTVKYDVTSITQHEVPDCINNYILQHLRWNRGFNEVARNRWLQILLNKKLPFLRRIDAIIFSLGYVDRLLFCTAFFLTLLSLFLLPSYHFPYWVWPIFLGIPALEILIGLFAEKEKISIYLRLPLILSMFSVDIFVAVKALSQDIVRRPTQWYKTPRVGDGA